MVIDGILKPLLRVYAALRYALRQSINPGVIKINKYSRFGSEGSVIL